MRWKYSRWKIVALAMAVLSAGCSKPNVRIYNVPKDGLSIASNGIEEAPEEIRWVKPDSWESLPGTALRKGNFRFMNENGEFASIYLSAHPDPSNGLRSVMNDWLHSLGKPPVGVGDFLEAARSLKIGGRDALELFHVADADELSGVSSFRGVSILSANWSWEIVITGPLPLVESQSEEFDSFLRSINFERPANDHVSNDQSSESQFVYTIPEGWEEVDHSKFTVASFLIQKEGLPDANVSISWFPGEAGGIHANVNRWRRQIGLKEWIPREIDRAKRIRAFGNRTFSIFDLRSYQSENMDKTSERILAAMTYDGQGTWFIKLRGEPFVVETQSRKFFSFLEKSEFGEGEPAQ